MNIDRDIVSEIMKAHIAGQTAERERVLKIIDMHIKHRRGSVQAIALEVLRAHVTDERQKAIEHGKR